MNNVTVIKLGGSLLDDGERRARALRLIVDRWNRGERVVLVHGGGKHVDAALSLAGIPKRTHAGLRITDDATLEIVVSVLAGAVNKMLVAELTALGVRAAGISGCDGATLVADRHEPIDGIDLGHVGRVTGSNRMLVRTLMTAGVLPVVSTVAQGPGGTLLNVNADSGAAAIAIAHGASTLHFITDVAGLMGRDGQVVSSLTARDAHVMMATDVIGGGMRPKLIAALAALDAGVGSIAIGDESTFTTTAMNANPAGGTHLVAA